MRLPPQPLYTNSIQLLISKLAEQSKPRICCAGGSLGDVLLPSLAQLCWPPLLEEFHHWWRSSSKKMHAMCLLKCWVEATTRDIPVGTSQQKHPDLGDEGLPQHRIQKIQPSCDNNGPNSGFFTAPLLP